MLAMVSRKGYSWVARADGRVWSGADEKNTYMVGDKHEPRVRPG